MHQVLTKQNKEMVAREKGVVNSLSRESWGHVLPFLLQASPLVLTWSS